MKKIVLLILFIFILSGCNKNDMYDKTLFYMDTAIEVKLYDVDEEHANKVLSDIEKMYEKYHKLTDRYNEYEDVINVYYLNNVLKVNEKIEISDELSEIINYGIKMYDETDGYINIAMGNVIDVWKEYREKESGVPKLYELDKPIDISYISLTDNIYLKKKDVKLDLGAYVKGYVTELVGKYLEDENINKYLINAGGNVKLGNKYRLKKYNVGLEEPFNTSNIYKTLSVENVSIVTSGSYQRYYEYDGNIYSHIINPKTLFPDNYTKSVTVITENSAYADIMSTYLFMLPIEDGLKLVNEKEGIEAIWYSDQIYYSDSFDKYEQK